MRSPIGLIPLILLAAALSYFPNAQAAEENLSPSGELPFTATFQPSSSGALNLPFSFGVRFTAWWNDLIEPSSAAEFRSDAVTAQVLPVLRPSSRQRPAADTADLRSSRFAVNLLAHRPFGNSPAFPEGRWSPYLGVGTGAQLSPIRVSLLSDMDTGLAPTLQVVTGVQFFMTRSFALFGEYRFTPLDRPFSLQTEALSPGINRLIGGFALHF